MRSRAPLKAGLKNVRVVKESNDSEVMINSRGKDGVLEARRRIPMNHRTTDTLVFLSRF